jgi:hypothetical protein
VDARDVALGLSYLPSCAVLVIAAELAPDAEASALEGAAYHGASVIAIVAPGAAVSEQLAAAGTVLEAPAAGVTAFAELVGRYAAALDRGDDPAAAFRQAARSGGWEGRRR